MKLFKISNYVYVVALITVFLSACGGGKNSAGKAGIKEGNWQLDAEAYINSIKENVAKNVKSQLEDYYKDYMNTESIKYVMMNDEEQEKAKEQDSTEILEFGKKYVENEIKTMLDSIWTAERKRLKEHSVLFYKGKITIRNEKEVRTDVKWAMKDDNSKIEFYFEGTDEPVSFDIVKVTDNTIQFKSFFEVSPPEDGFEPVIIYKYAD